MYFPYLRGRQFELIALRELLEKGLIGNKIIPVIEPIKPTSTLVKTLELFANKQHLCALIRNPEVGEFISAIQKKGKKEDLIINKLSSALEKPLVIKAYIMKKNISTLLVGKENLNELLIVNPRRDCMDEFIKVYEEIEPRYTLIPEDRSFGRKAKNSKVIFGDKFKKSIRNVDYLECDDEFFSEDHLYFDAEGFKGFSDYSVVGSEYSESGFAPLAVAIHIVYFNKKKELRVHHFVSDSNDDINDPAGKFGEAVGKLDKWVDENKVVVTVGLHELIECYKKGRYPGLGTVKKYSIMHHLELMNKFLEGEI